MSLFAFDNSYAALPERFYTKQIATPVTAPSWLALNEGLATDLGLDPTALRENLAVFAGNERPEGATPLAQLYAGHQFGNFSPQLGDGRALLLGEIASPRGRRHDLQLKGSGPTPYSRMGDGRSALGPVIREYLVSEAMAALGLPTTRALAAVRTGETVLRQNGPEPGGILTRVASSHIRVGTFEVFASRGDRDAVQTLLDYTLARHCPNRGGALGLVAHMIEVQTKLIAQWMGLGFIHGVMNTDNMALSGETIDYGPCAFMEVYDPAQVFSSIDQFGRYAYANQPNIGLWNITQLANALLILWEDTETGVAELTEALKAYAPSYEAAWHKVLSAKVGLKPKGVALGKAFLALLETHKLDFANSFRALLLDDPRTVLGDPEEMQSWLAEWRAAEPDLALMAKSNPVVIPRNHRIAEAIAAAEQGDDAPFHALHAILQTPFEETEANLPYRAPAKPHETVTRTFCGT